MIPKLKYISYSSFLLLDAEKGGKHGFRGLDKCPFQSIRPEIHATIDAYFRYVQFEK